MDEKQRQAGPAGGFPAVEYLLAVDVGERHCAERIRRPKRGVQVKHEVAGGGQ